MKVAILMGSDSDFPVVQKTYDILKDFGIEVTCNVISAHRNPKRVLEFAENAEKEGYELIIGAAGKAAHLPGVIASSTPLPVIGLPIKSSTMDGMDSLLSIVQMPSGVPVATVGINGALNAGLLAIQILSVKYPELRDKMKNYKIEMKHAVDKKDENLQGLL